MTTRRKRSAKSPRIEALIGEDRELFKGLLAHSTRGRLGCGYGPVRPGRFKSLMGS